MFEQNQFFFRGANFSFPLGKKTYIMGILNITPDSFSDGGLYFRADDAVKRALQMQEQGANVVDVGAMSTRPGSERIPVEEEIHRLKCLPEICRELTVPISVDTFNPETARYALNCGAAIINDVSGRHLPEMAALIREFRCGYILMHAQNERAETDGCYPNGVVCAVDAFFRNSLDRLHAYGIADENLCIDPGFGFSKNTAENTLLLQNLHLLKKSQICCLAALSRKRFVGQLSGVEEAERRMIGSVAAAVISVQQGADMLRVHDVAETVQAIRLADAIYR